MPQWCYVKNQKRCSCIFNPLRRTSISAGICRQVDYLATFASTLKSLHLYIHHSLVRMETLAVWQEAFSEPVLTVKRPCATSWLSLSESVTSLSRTYSGMKLETTTQAESLLAVLESWRFAATTYFLWDILGDLTQLSRKVTFQFTDNFNLLQAPFDH